MWGKTNSVRFLINKNLMFQFTKCLWSQFFKKNLLWLFIGTMWMYNLATLVISRRCHYQSWGVVQQGRQHLGIMIIKIQPGFLLVDSVGNYQKEMSLLYSHSKYHMFTDKRILQFIQILTNFKWIIYSEKNHDASN